MLMALATRTIHRDLCALSYPEGENVECMLEHLKHTCEDFINTTDDIYILICQFVIPELLVLSLQHISMHENILSWADENIVICDALPGQAPHNAAI